VSSFHRLVIKWKVDDLASSTITSFKVQVSLDSEFSAPNTTHTISNTPQLIIPTVDGMDMRKVVHFVRVKSVGTPSTRVSDWSTLTAKWRNIGDDDEDCSLESQYLNTASLNPFEWDCHKCPPGGSCSGSLTFDQVDAMFGWSQCPARAGDNNDTKKFARCMYAPACLGGTNNELLEKYKFVNGSDIRDPADCKDNNCIAKCNEGYANGSRLCGQCAYKYSHDGLTGECKLCPPFLENVGIAALGLLCGILGLVVLIQITLSDGGTLDESDGAKVRFYCSLYVCILFK
jgi:hypothetical protein